MSACGHCLNYNDQHDPDCIYPQYAMAISLLAKERDAFGKRETEILAELNKARVALQKVLQESGRPRMTYEPLIEVRENRKALEDIASITSEALNQKGFIPIILLLVFGAAVAMTGCVTLAEHRRAVEVARLSGEMDGLVKGSEPWEQAYLACEKQMAEAHSLAQAARCETEKGCRWNGHHCICDADAKSNLRDIMPWESMSVPNYDGGGR